jgi:hypothetical protein
MELNLKLLSEKEEEEKRWNINQHYLSTDLTLRSALFNHSLLISPTFSIYKFNSTLFSFWVLIQDILHPEREKMISIVLLSVYLIL